MNVLWCVTGAGHRLKESYRFMSNLQRVTIAFSNAGYEVARMYGLLKDFERLGNEIILEKNQYHSSPFCGRMIKGEYDVVVVAPCTANTIAKLAYGISDTLITNIVAQAIKAKIPVFILPTDAHKIQKTKIPVTIDADKCKNCDVCLPMLNCPSNAFFITERPRIDLLKCNACQKCIPHCKYGAITFGSIVEVRCREIDIRNVENVGKIEGITIFERFEDLNL